MLRGPYAFNETSPLRGPYEWNTEGGVEQLSVRIMSNTDNRVVVVEVSGEPYAQDMDVTITGLQIDGIDLPDAPKTTMPAGTAPETVAAALAVAYDGYQDEGQTVQMSASADGTSITFEVTTGTEFTSTPTVSAVPTPAVVPLAITTPTAGEVIGDATAPISGEGAEPNAEVTLWNIDVRDMETDNPNATVTANKDGDFVFGGDTQAYGEVTWAVKSGDEVSEGVPVTYPDKPEV